MGASKLRWSKATASQEQQTPMTAEMRLMEFAFRLGAGASSSASVSSSDAANSFQARKPKNPLLALEDAPPTATHPAGPTASPSEPNDSVMQDALEEII